VDDNDFTQFFKGLHYLECDTGEEPDFIFEISYRSELKQSA
jgi:hypothetical protein